MGVVQVSDGERTSGDYSSPPPRHKLLRRGTPAILGLGHTVKVKAAAGAVHPHTIAGEDEESRQPHSSGWNCIVFIHFYSASHSMSLSEALPIIAIDIVSEFICRSATGNFKWRSSPRSLRGG